jgi:hypothetical protein
MTDQPKKPHTPLPWFPYWANEAGWIHSPSSHHAVAKMIHEVGVVGPDAEFICLAVNCHDDLLAALKDCLACSDCGPELHAQITEVIARAEGSQG